MTAKTKSQIQATEVASLVRARNPLIWIVTREESRVEGFIFEAAAAAGYTARTWDVAAGICDIKGKPDIKDKNDPGDCFDVIETRARGVGYTEVDRCVWVMRDLPVWLQGPAGATPLRKLRNLVRLLPGTARDRAQTIIVLSTSGDVPAELSAHATVIEWPLPDRAEIAAILDATVNSLPDALRADAITPETREIAIDATVGLTDEEARSCYAKSLVQTKKIDTVSVTSEKKRIITRERVLEWHDPIPGGLDAVGGLEYLKTWLTKRRSAYSPAAREYGLPAPKGVVLVGVPGCGKSYLAKCLATGWEVPLLKLDLGALKSKFVGESEANLRKAFRVIEALGRCVVWVDEIEKALQGATSGSADGGVSSDALGTFLTWMQERKSEAFVVCTANDVSGLPPEFLRKGRFDEVFFVDLPNAKEREQVLAATLKSFKRSLSAEGLAEVSAATKDYTGSEIAAIVPDALFEAFEDGAREITADDLVKAAGDVVPLAQTAKEKIATLREWAKGRARYATVQAGGITSGPRGGERALDI